MSQGTAKKGKKPKITKSGKVSKGPKVPAEWLYMNSSDLETRQIYELFAQDHAYKAEYWEEAGVLEISIPEAGSVDMEEMECEFDDEQGAAFIDVHQIKKMYEVTIMPDGYEKAKVVMEKIIQNLGGFFCGDTEDFQPMVK